MRIPHLIAAPALIAALTACEPTEEEKNAPLGVNAIDENNLNDIMLTIADPADAVEYFRRALATSPDRTELKRGLALSLARDKQHREAHLVFKDLVVSGVANDNDRIEYAHTLAKISAWDDVETTLAGVSSGGKSYRRSMIEALLADHKENWPAADASYGQARDLTTKPAAVENNWGVSKMARGDMKGAEGHFERAIAFDPSMFSAKNNLAIAYGLQKSYRVPLVTLNEEERALILHNLGVIALRQGDQSIAKGFFAQAIETHPRTFPAAQRKLAAIEAIVQN